MKVLKNIKLGYVVIVVTILISIFFIMYYYLNLTPKEANLDISNIAEIDNNVSVIDVSSKKKRIFCNIDDKYINDREYNNYVMGEGKAKRINFSIILQKNDKYYKVKTIHTDTNKDGEIELQATLFSKYIDNNTNILLYDNDTHMLYKGVIK